MSSHCRRAPSAWRRSSPCTSARCTGSMSPAPSGSTRRRRTRTRASAPRSGGSVAKACPLIDSSRSLVRLARCGRRPARGAEAGARVLSGGGPPLGLDLLCRAGELLPHWYDDWVVIERERFRQLRLHALDALCESLAAAGRYAAAVEAGRASVAAEPLRESAHRLLIQAHLAEGNRARRPASTVRSATCSRRSSASLRRRSSRSSSRRYRFGDAAVTVRDHHSGRDDCGRRACRRNDRSYLGRAGT